MATTLEERVTTLEAEVKRLSERAEREPLVVSGRTTPDFLDRYVGMFAEDPTFEDAVRLGREWRNADRPEDSDDQREAYDAVPS